MGSKDMRRAAVASLVVVGGGFFAARALARDALPVLLTYEAPATCPSEKDFVDMIEQDGGRLVRVPDGQQARSFALQIAETSPMTGRLVVREIDGTEGVRELNAPHCDALVRAAAIVVALSLDAPLAMPSNSTTPLPPPAPDPAEPSPPAESLEPLPAVPGIAAGIPAEEPWPEASVPPDDESSVPSSPRHRAFRLDVSGEGVLGTGARPTINPGFAAYIELLEETPRFFAPSIRVGFQVDKDQGWADLNMVRRTVGRIDACPFRGVLAQPWSDDAFTLQTCARVDVGKMEVATWANGTEVGEQQLLLSTAGLLRLRWMSKSLFVELEGGAVVPLVRARFPFGTKEYPLDPRDFEIPPIAWTTGLGFGVFLL
jgi:hypothetical protein